MSQNEQEIEKMIVERNLNAPRVHPSQIDALMEEVQYIEHVQPLESTTTLVHAFLWGTFYLASGKSHAVSRENFNREIGVRVATENAEAKARDALWDFEGYVLKKTLRQQQAQQFRDNEGRTQTPVDTDE
jgi:hypothetical protein